jgi:hypothetical protein
VLYYLPVWSKHVLYFFSHLLFFAFSGLRRATTCIFNAFRARRFIREHRLQLARAANDGGMGIALPDEAKTGIPYDCGFGFPILPLIFVVNMISLIYWLIWKESLIFINKNLAKFFFFLDALNQSGMLKEV